MVISLSPPIPGLFPNLVQVRLGLFLLLLLRRAYSHPLLPIVSLGGNLQVMIVVKVHSRISPMISTVSFLPRRWVHHISLIRTGILELLGITVQSIQERWLPITYRSQDPLRRALWFHLRPIVLAQCHQCTNHCHPHRGRMTLQPDPCLLTLPSLAIIPRHVR